MFSQASGYAPWPRKKNFGYLHIAELSIETASSNQVPRSHEHFDNETHTHSTRVVQKK